MTKIEPTRRALDQVRDPLFLPSSCSPLSLTCVRKPPPFLLLLLSRVLSRSLLLYRPLARSLSRSLALARVLSRLLS